MSCASAQRDLKAMDSHRAPLEGSTYHFIDLQSSVQSDRPAVLAQASDSNAYFIQVINEGRVSFQVGILGRYELLASRENYRVMTPPGEQPNGWRATGSQAVVSPSDETQAKRLMSETDKLARLKDLGRPCLPPGYSQMLHSHLLPGKRISERPFVILIWRDHYSNVLGCDERASGVEHAVYELVRSYEPKT